MRSMQTRPRTIINPTRFAAYLISRYVVRQLETEHYISNDGIFVSQDCVEMLILFQRDIKCGQQSKQHF